MWITTLHCFSHTLHFLIQLISCLVAEKPNSTAVTSVKSVARQIPSSSLNNMESAQRQNISAGQAAMNAIQVSFFHNSLITLACFRTSMSDQKNSVPQSMPRNSCETMR